MKNLNVRILFFFSSFLLHAPNLLAQTTTMRDVLNIAFANVDKTRVPTKYLKEFGYNFMPMNIFNGVLADTNVLDMSAWRLLYGSFLTSYVGTSTPAISLLNEMKGFLISS